VTKYQRIKTSTVANNNLQGCYCMLLLQQCTSVTVSVFDKSWKDEKLFICILPLLCCEDFFFSLQKMKSCPGYTRQIYKGCSYSCVKHFFTSCAECITLMKYSRDFFIAFKLHHKSCQVEVFVSLSWCIFIGNNS
jgi:hypothetical protein